MCGGIIVQVVGRAVEVLDSQTFDRCWRLLPEFHIAVAGDQLWWESGQGYLSREGKFVDSNIGRCVACNPHGRHAAANGGAS